MDGDVFELKQAYLRGFGFGCYQQILQMRALGYVQQIHALVTIQRYDEGLQFLVTNLAPSVAPILGTIKFDVL